MKVGLTRRRVLGSLAVALLALGSFVVGFGACLNLRGAISNSVRSKYPRQTGDATLSVRAGVLDALSAFQAGYVKRDPKELDYFMDRLFSKADDVSLLGTDAGEWVRGYPAVSEFIRGDWQNWGDFRFDVDGAVISASGDIAWITSIGMVHGRRADRPIRFTAVLKRDGDRWLFRQLQFQWEERDPSPTEFLRLTLVKLVPGKFRDFAKTLRSISQR